MNSILSSLPFLRLCFAYVLGIVFFYYLFPEINPTIFCLTFFLINIFIWFSAQDKISSITKPIFGAFIFFFVFSLGGTSLYLFHEKHQANHFSNFLALKPRYALAEITSPLSVKEKSIGAQVSIKGFYLSDNLVSTKGHAIIYFKKDSTSASLNAGDELLIKCVFNAIQNQGNPGQFDYKSYMQRKNISWSSYLNSSEYIKTNKNNQSWLNKIADDLSKKVIQAFTELFPERNHHALLSAMIIGHDDDIDQNMLDVFSRTGTVHILSVSGLHVGVLFVFLNFVFGFLVKIKHGNKIRLVLIFGTLWFYALVTGLSPAVVRSALMFSLIMFGKALNKNTSSLNIVFVSAFLVLLFNPMLLWDIGFQLSYLAVIGILIFYDGFYWSVESSLPFFEPIWKLICVSLAAQILTFPLGLYYFHQFPLLFLVANLIIIPLSTLVMYAGCLSIFTSFIPCDSNPFVMLTKFLLNRMNVFATYISDLSFSSISNIHFPFLYVAIMILLITLLSLAFIKRSYSYLIASLIGLVFLISLDLSSFVSKHNQHFMCAYNSKNGSIMDFMDGYNISVIQSGVNKQEEKFTTNENRIAHFIQRKKSISIQNGVQLISWNDKIILLTDTFSDLISQVIKRAHPNLILLHNFNFNRYKSESMILEENLVIVADASSKTSIITNFYKVHVSPSLKLWLIKNQGAFVFHAN